MKRDKRLYPLSWQHHELLLFADRIKMALVSRHPAYSHSAEELFEMAVRFWDNLLENHLNVERELFNPFFTGSQECRKEVEEILIVADRLACSYASLPVSKRADGSLGQKLIELSEQVIHHVRFEEGILFPKVQIEWSEEILEKIGRELALRLPRNCGVNPKRPGGP